jgi:hypothetical protein
MKTKNIRSDKPGQRASSDANWVHDKVEKNYIYTVVIYSSANLNITTFLSVGFRLSSDWAEMQDLAFLITRLQL